MKTEIEWHPVIRGNLPQVYVGDRLLAVVFSRDREEGPLRPQLTILTATETGWNNEWGFDLADCDWWAFEAQAVRGFPKIGGE